MERRHEGLVSATVAVAAGAVVLACAWHALTALGTDQGGGEQQALLYLVVLLLVPGALVGWWLHGHARREVERRATLRADLVAPAPDARAAAARELGSRLGCSADLIAATDDPEPFVRRELAEGLATRGTECLPLLTELLADSDSSVRLAAARSLHEIVVSRGALLPPDLARFPDLEAALDFAATDPDRELREQVAAVLHTLERIPDGGPWTAVPPPPLAELGSPAERLSRRGTGLVALGAGMVLAGALCGWATASSPASPWHDLAWVLGGLGWLQLLLCAVLGGWQWRRHRTTPRLPWRGQE